VRLWTYLLRATILITCADMDEWDGYRWVDGWPVSPPKQEQKKPSKQEVRVQPETNEEQEMLEEKDGEMLPPSLNPTQHTVQVTPHKNDTSGRADGSEVSGSSYITSRLSESDEDDRDYDQNKISLGSGYIQCRAAREAACSVEVFEISCNENVSTSTQKKGDRVGSMENSGDGSVGDCFKGARIEKNGVLVNQYVSCSFNPATLVCITCSKEHGILEGGEGPECFVLSDQNFVATLPGSDTKKCLKIQWAAII
jgi:hypothetical protein